MPRRWAHPDELQQFLVISTRRDGDGLVTRFAATEADAIRKANSSYVSDTCGDVYITKILHRSERR